MKKCKKESKSLGVLKKVFRKNEIVIYTIALMLVTAGYFNYTANIDNNSIETYSESIQNVAKGDDTRKEINENKSNNIINMKEATKEENEFENKNEIHKVAEAKKEVGEKNQENTAEVKNISETKYDNKEKEQNTIIAKTENTEVEDEEDIGDAKLVNSNSVVSDYFVESKLKRDTNYADMISTYTKIIEDSSVSETQKAIAMNEITKITNLKNAIAVCENILLTKGFENYVVFVNNESVNVVVQVKEKLGREKVAQIQNIVSRELNSKIENIHITEK